jgi:hypothetical protein
VVGTAPSAAREPVTSTLGGGVRITLVPGGVPKTQVSVQPASPLTDPSALQRTHELWLLRPIDPPPLSAKRSPSRARPVLARTALATIWRTCSNGAATDTRGVATQRSVSESRHWSSRVLPVSDSSSSVLPVAESRHESETTPPPHRDSNCTSPPVASACPRVLGAAALCTWCAVLSCVFL